MIVETGSTCAVNVSVVDDVLEGSCMTERSRSVSCITIEMFMEVDLILSRPVILHHLVIQTK